MTVMVELEVGDQFEDQEKYLTICYTISDSPTTI